MGKPDPKQEHHDDKQQHGHDAHDHQPAHKFIPIHHSRPQKVIIIEQQGSGRGQLVFWCFIALIIVVCLFIIVTPQTKDTSLGSSLASAIPSVTSAPTCPAGWANSFPYCVKPTPAPATPTPTPQGATVATSTPVPTQAYQFQPQVVTTAAPIPTPTVPYAYTLTQPNVSELLGGGALASGTNDDRLTSTSGRYVMVMQADGNLVIYDEWLGGVVTWASGTSRASGTYTLRVPTTTSTAFSSYAGYVIITDASNNVIWNSQSAFSAAYSAPAIGKSFSAVGNSFVLSLGTNGILSFYQNGYIASGNMIWSTPYWN